MCRFQRRAVGQISYMTYVLTMPGLKCLPISAFGDGELFRAGRGNGEPIRGGG